MLVSAPVTAGNSMRTPLLSVAKKGNRIGDLVGETFGGYLAAGRGAGVVQGGVVRASHGAGIAAIMGKCAHSQNAVSAQTLEVIFLGPVVGATGWDVGESCATDHLDGQIFSLLARYGHICGLDWTPSEAINERQALDDGIATGAGLLGKGNGKSRGENAQAGRAGIDEDAADGLAIRSAAGSANGHAGERFVNCRGIYRRACCRSGIHGDGLNVVYGRGRAAAAAGATAAGAAAANCRGQNSCQEQ